MSLIDIPGVKSVDLEEAAGTVLTEQEGFISVGRLNGVLWFALRDDDEVFFGGSVVAAVKKAIARATTARRLRTRTAGTWDEVATRR